GGINRRLSRISRMRAERVPLMRATAFTGTDRSPHRLALDAVPPGTDAGRELVVAVDHLHRPAIALSGELQAQLARARLLLGRAPGGAAPPRAGPSRALARVPGGGVDAAAAPAVFHHEARRRPGVERGEEIAGMSAERGGEPPLLADREIVTLPDIVEAVELH